MDLAPGSRHTIFSATCLDGESKEGTPCVLKRFSAGSAGVGGSGQGGSQLRALRKACHIMCSLQHPNIMQLQGACRDGHGNWFTQTARYKMNLRHWMTAETKVAKFSHPTSCAHVCTSYTD